MDTKEKESNNSLKDLIIEALGTVYDPEIPVSIWELGLVYNIDIDEKFNVLITMTLTTPNCQKLKLFQIELQRLYQNVKMWEMSEWRLFGSQLGLKII